MVLKKKEKKEGKGEKREKERKSEKMSAWFSGMTATELGSLREEKERPSGGFEGKTREKERWIEKPGQGVDRWGELEGERRKGDYSGEHRRGLGKRVKRNGERERDKEREREREKGSEME